MSSSEIISDTIFVGKADSPAEELKDFGYSDCGEPQYEQHLVFDFTPDPVIDNDIVQKKICDFWKLINNSPEIQNLKVQPKKCESRVSSAGTSVQRIEVTKQPSDENAYTTKTACSVLEVVAKKDLIKRAFETKLPHTICSSPSYRDDERIEKKKKTHRAPIICRCTEPCKPCPVKKAAPSAVSKLCTKLEQWDEKHPKCMDPPGHPPKLQSCTIQRQLFEM